MQDSESIDVESTEPTRTTTECVFDALETLVGARGNPVPVGTVIEHVALTSDHHISDICNEISRLLTHGEIYQPSPATIKLTTPPRFENSIETEEVADASQ